MPRRRHLRGSWLHRVLGERLFCAELWKINKRGLAGGLAVGLFIAFTPTMGAQMIIAVFAAYFLRVNVAVAIAASFVTNPFTAALVYALQFQLGVWLIGVPDAAHLEGMSLAMRGCVRYVFPLWAGSLVVATVAALLGYCVGCGIWTASRRAREARNARRRATLASRGKLPLFATRTVKLGRNEIAHVDTNA